MEEKKNLAEEYLAKVREEKAIYFKGYPNMPLYQENSIKIAFYAGRESVMENVPDLKWDKSSEDMITKTLLGADINWEQRRYEIAKDALNGLLSGKTYVNPGFKTTEAADLAVEFANDLIRKLKRKYKNC